MKFSEQIQKSIDWWNKNQHSFNPAMSEALDLVYTWSKKGILPATATSRDVEYIWVTCRGDYYGVTNAMAQSLRIVSEKHGLEYSMGELFCVNKNLPKDMQYYTLSL